MAVWDLSASSSRNAGAERQTGGVNQTLTAQQQNRVKETERVMDGCIDLKWCNMDSDGQLERKELLIEGVWMEGSNNS